MFGILLRKKARKRLRNITTVCVRKHDTCVIGHKINIKCQQSKMTSYFWQSFSPVYKVIEYLCIVYSLLLCVCVARERIISKV